MSVLEQIKNKFGDNVAIFEKSKKRAYVTVGQDRAKEVAGYLFNELGARFSMATGIDTRLGVEILYHMTFDASGIVISIRTLVEKPELKTESFTDVVPAVEWIERELHEMFGVDFSGHPGLKRLLLPDDWPDDEYPFRKKTFGSENEGIGR
jgi:Ni,Fe-hydrogenase III component G